MAILICERMKFEEAGYAFSEQTLWLHPDLAAGVYDTHESARGGAGRIMPRSRERYGTEGREEMVKGLLRL